jgi:hypothetical protein
MRARKKKQMRRICKFTLPRIIVSAAFLLAMANTPVAQSRGTEAIPSIKFAPGKKLTTVKGSVQLPHGIGDMHNDGADRYSFHYRAGQRMTFNLESEGDRAIFTITRADADLPDLPVAQRRWSGRLPESGDYYINIWTREGTANYTLRISLR